MKDGKRRHFSPLTLARPTAAAPSASLLSFFFLPPLPSPLDGPFFFISFLPLTLPLCAASQCIVSTAALRSPCASLSLTRALRIHYFCSYLFLLSPIPPLLAPRSTMRPWSCPAVHRPACARFLFPRLIGRQLFVLASFESFLFLISRLIGSSHFSYTDSHFFKTFESVRSKTNKLQALDKCVRKRSISRSRKPQT